MDMQNEVVATGKTVEEALKRAYEELGVDGDDSEFEILQIPKKGFLGLKNYPAKVKVVRHAEEIKPLPAAKEAVIKRAEQETGSERRQKPERNVERRPRAQEEKPQPPRKRPVAAAEEKKRDSGAKENYSVEHHINTPTVEKSWAATPEGDLSAKSKLAMSYLSDVLREMGVKNATLKARESKESIDIMLEGEGLGVIIGRRGETLDAVQYLTSLVANRVDGDYTRISIDSGDYRKKRAETLERLAVKLARNAVKTGRPQRLEPMNPYERRIIHAAVGKVEGATSSSIGEEPTRRVVISSTSQEGAAAPRGGGNGERGAQRGSRDGGRDGGKRTYNKGGRSDNRQRGGKPEGRPYEGKPYADRKETQVTGAIKEPRGKLRDNEIEIPMDLAPNSLPPVTPAKPKAKEETSAPTKIEKDGVLYGKLDI